MTRSEHVRWCKTRVLAYLPMNPREAVTSMLSDLTKHDETRPLVEGPMGFVGTMAAASGSVEEARRFIEGFAD